MTQHANRRMVGAIARVIARRRAPESLIDATVAALVTLVAILFWYGALALFGN